MSEPEPPTTTTQAADEAPKKYPKGVVLGKDGKPCRTCNSLAAFKSAAPKKAAASTSTTSTSTTTTPRTDCPPDSEALGRATWTLLHSISAQYPTQPSTEEQTTLKTFFGAFGKLYPCWVCAEDFQAYMARERIRTSSRKDFGEWLCEAHNEVNRKLGKKEFDCARWEERWRDGWKDGNCE